MGKAVRKILFSLAALLLAALLCFSGWQFFLALGHYQKEEALKQKMLAHKPASAAESVQGAHTHSGLAEIQAINPHVVGWLTIPGTGIDYAFVQTANNSDYLRRDLCGEYSLAGTIFLDYRNTADFTDSKTILYGHNMQNGSMFGDLEKYKNGEFMQANNQGTIWLEGGELSFSIFACLEAEPDDEELYNLTATSVTNERPLLIFSTCLGTSGEKRLVVLAQYEENNK